MGITDFLPTWVPDSGYKERENDFVQACSDRVDGDYNGGIKVLIGCRVDETNEQTEGERTKCMNRGACINETQEKGGGVQQNTQTGENESP